MQDDEKESRGEEGRVEGPIWGGRVLFDQKTRWVPAQTRRERVLGRPHPCKEKGAPTTPHQVIDLCVCTPSHSEVCVVSGRGGRLSTHPIKKKNTLPPHRTSHVTSLTSEVTVGQRSPYTHRHRRRARRVRGPSRVPSPWKQGPLLRPNRFRVQTWRSERNGKGTGKRHSGGLGYQNDDDDDPMGPRPVRGSTRPTRVAKWFRFLGSRSCSSHFLS